MCLCPDLGCSGRGSSGAWTDLSSGGKKELLEYWICRLSSVLPERASSAVVLEEELPVISTSTEPLFCFVLFLYVAVKLIAGSHLSFFFLILSSFEGNSWRGICRLTLFYPERLALNPPRRYGGARALLLHNTICMYSRERRRKRSDLLLDQK